MSELRNLELRPRGGGARTCPYCRAVLDDGEPRWECPGCGTSQHLECASENERCAIHGCGTPAPVVTRTSVGRIRVVPRAAPSPTAPACAACRAGVDVSEAWLCPACGAEHHSECVANLGRCASPSCGRLQFPMGARVDPRRALETAWSGRVVPALLALVPLGAGGILLQLHAEALRHPSRFRVDPPAGAALAFALAGVLLTRALFAGDGAPLGRRAGVGLLAAALVAVLTVWATLGTSMLFFAWIVVALYALLKVI